MNPNNWRENVDKRLRPYLERLIFESLVHKDAYKYAKDKSRAQLWIVLSILARQNHDLDLKVKYLEKTLQSLYKKGKKDSAMNGGDRKRDMLEVERLIKEIASGRRPIVAIQKKDNRIKPMKLKRRKIRKIRRPKIKTNF